MISLILGSQSPRRREILSYFSLPFTVAKPDYDEEALPFEGDPQDYGAQLARGKGEALLPLFPQATILTADTLVFQEGILFGKPRDRAEAALFLKQLAGKWHSVYTAVALYNNGAFKEQQVEETKVLFNTLSSEQIDRYLNAIPWHDKAGGYAIQLGGALLVRKIDGCFYNVMGLPINAVASLLATLDIDLWRYLRSFS